MKTTLLHILISWVVVIFLIQNSLFAKPVDVHSAHRVAVHFLEKNGKSNSNPDLSGFELNPSTTVSWDQTPLYHVFTLSPQGFIIVAADDAIHPILAYSYEGIWDQENLPNGVRQWMNGYKEEILAVKNNTLPSNESISEEWRTLLMDNTERCETHFAPSIVAPLLTTTWDQKFPYNAMCPVDSNAGVAYSYHVPAGCGAVAMAQLMYYWRHPMQGIGQHCIDTVWQIYGTLCADFGNTAYSWNGMVNHTDQECVAAALLCYQAGVSIDMNYGANVSLSGFADIPVALMTYFRFSENMNLQQRAGFMYNNWIALLKSSLDEGKPVLYSGFNGGEGHIFLCDGYDANNLFHFNWGWGGEYNGYFNVNNLNPGTATYNQSQSAIFNIQPDPIQYPTYCTGQTTISSFDFGSIEDGSGPLHAYQTASDCRWLIQPMDSVSSISLHFVRFGVAPSDWVEVYKGNSTADPLIASFTGSSVPSDLTVSTNQLLVRLISGTAPTLNGFLAEYATTTLDFCRSDTLLFSNEGELFDGSSNHLYRNNSHCLWYILPFGAPQVTLFFTEFDTEKDYDFINVYDLVNPNPIVKLSGHFDQPPPPVISSTGMMLVEFITNEMNRDTGWNATYTIEVGTNSIQQKHDITVCPNPASDNFTIRGSTHQGEKVISYSIMDALGRECQSGTLSNPTAEISCSSLRRGFYCLRVMFSDGSYADKKLIVRK